MITIDGWNKSAYIGSVFIINEKRKPSKISVLYNFSTRAKVVFQAILPLWCVIFLRKFKNRIRTIFKQCCVCFDWGMHTQCEIFFFRVPKFFLFVKNDQKVKNKYVFTSQFDRDRGSKSDLTNTFMSKWLP